MPTTMFNWLTATRNPRLFAGAISVMYMGQTTEAPPTATPPRNRKNRSACQFHDAAHPTEEARKNTARRARTRCRPHQSAGRPAVKAPTMVPIRALETVTRRLLPSENTWRRTRRPEITAVSKPNRNEPSEAIAALKRSIRPSRGGRGFESGAGRGASGGIATF